MKLKKVKTVDKILEKRLNYVKMCCLNKYNLFLHYYLSKK